MPTLEERRRELIRQKLIGKSKGGKIKSTFKKGAKLAKKVFDAQQEAAMGATKGIASTLSGASELGQKALKAVTPTFKKVSTGEEFQPEIAKIPERFTTPVGKWQRRGFIAEQLLEFLAPSSAVVKAEKGVMALAKLDKLKKTKKLAELVIRSGTEAVTIGSTTALQKGEIEEDAKTAALYGSLLPIIGKVAVPLKKFVVSKIPSSMINKIIRPANREFQFGKNPGGAVANEGIVANSIEGLNIRIRHKKTEIGSMLSKNVKKSKARGSVQEELDQVLQDYVPNVTDPNTIKQMKNTLTQLLFKTKVRGAKVIKIGRKDLSNMSADDIWKFQQKIGDLTIWTGNPMEKPLNKMMAALYRKVGKKLELVSPGTKDLQFRYANLVGADKAIQNRLSNLARDSFRGSGIGERIGVGTVAAGVQIARGDEITDALAIGALIFAGGHALRRTAVQTRVAAGLAQLRKLKIGGKTGERIFGLQPEIKIGKKLMTQ